VGYSDAFSQKLELQIAQSSQASYILYVDERGFTRKEFVLSASAACFLELTTHPSVFLTTIIGDAIIAVLCLPEVEPYLGSGRNCFKLEYGGTHKGLFYTNITQKGRVSGPLGP
jgi:hypothetical protein